MNHVDHPESQNSVEFAAYSDCPAVTAEYPQGKGLNLVILWTLIIWFITGYQTHMVGVNAEKKFLFPELHFEFLNIAAKKRKDEFYIGWAIY